MIFKRCEFCHKYVFSLGFDAHVEKHLRLREDGQQTVYATLPEEQRRGVERAFRKAPRWYKHDVCGEVTGMPDEIIKTYLVDPWFYNHMTYCCGCENHVPESECYWTETGQNVADYKNELKMAVGNPPPDGE